MFELTALNYNWPNIKVDEGAGTEIVEKVAQKVRSYTWLTLFHKKSRVIAILESENTRVDVTTFIATLSNKVVTVRFIAHVPGDPTPAANDVNTFTTDPGNPFIAWFGAFVNAEPTLMMTYTVSC